MVLQQALSSRKISKWSEKFHSMVVRRLNDVNVGIGYKCFHVVLLHDASRVLIQQPPTHLEFTQIEDFQVYSLLL